MKFQRFYGEPRLLSGGLNVKHRRILKSNYGLLHPEPEYLCM